MSAVDARATGDQGWSTELVLTDLLGIYDFPEQLVSFPLDFPAGCVRRAHLTVRDHQGERVPHQLGTAREDRHGFLVHAVVHLRSELRRHETTTFVVGGDKHARARADDDGVALTVEGDGTALISGRRVAVRVPHGTTRYAGGTEVHGGYDNAVVQVVGIAASTAPAPIITLGRDLDNTLLEGSFVATRTSKVHSVRGEVVEHGPLFLRYRVTYLFVHDESCLRNGEGRRYVVDLVVETDEPHVTIDERLEGFRPEDGVSLKLSMRRLGPDGRLAMSNGGYAPDCWTPDGMRTYSGRFDGGLYDDGELPYQLGLYSPNSLGIMRSTVFWRDGGDGLAFCLNRMEDWRTDRPLVWWANGRHNLRFYSTDDDQYVLLGLEGHSRHWAVAALGQDELVIEAAGPRPSRCPLTSDLFDHYDNTAGGAGPDVRLWQRLSDFGLDWVKDLVLDWDEDPTVRLDLPARHGWSRYPKGHDDEWSHDEWGALYYYRFDLLADRFWDFSSDLGPVGGFGREHTALFPMHANNRNRWTDEERQKARAFLAFRTYLAERDTNFPYVSMMSGHPNFVMEDKHTLAFAAAMFPNHPHARRWRDAFARFLDSYLDAYVRAPDPAHRAEGGRHMESITTYSLQSMTGCVNAAAAIRTFDGSDLLDDQRVRDWARWYLCTLIPAEGGVRLVPPQGAHAADGNPPGHPYRGTLSALAEAVRQADPELGDGLLWAVQSGSDGHGEPAPVRVRSTLFADYGAVLWHDFGGPHEAHVNVQQLRGRGYRWQGANNGMLYYSAGGRTWSWNGAEDTADGFDIDALTVFRVNGAALDLESANAPGVTGVLYDFGSAQLYRAEGSNHPYLWRAVMLVRDDFLVVYDRLADEDVLGEFQWRGGKPEIYPVKDGPGDNLHLVAPAPLHVASREFGAVVNGTDYVFCSGEPFSVVDGPAAFDGTFGYARGRELALFAGNAISLDGFALSADGGDFGCSAAFDDQTGSVEGRVAGTEGGTITVTPPPAVRGAGYVVRVAGDVVDHDARIDGAVTFDVAVAQRLGLVAFVIEPSKRDGGAVLLP